MSNQTDKIIADYKTLSDTVENLRTEGKKIVVTIGSWDLLHIGHVRYLLEAKKHGDIVVVGVDTDRAIKLYKGSLRPVVPEKERMEMLSYQSCVDFITGVDDLDDDGAWQYNLISLIKPDVFVAVEDSYPKKQQGEISQHCDKLVVLPRQAENTSTSNMIQDTLKKHLSEMMDLLNKR